MITQRLGECFAAFVYPDFPAPVVEAAKLRLLDYLGVAVAGKRMGAYRPILDVFRQPGACTVIGTQEKLAALNAAVVNGFMAHSTWYEDGSRITGGHPSSSVFPALLALAEARACTGKQLIEATVTGYEAFNRIGVTMYPAAVRRGFQPTAILAPIASAAACAKLLGLDGSGIARAMNIAAPLGGGLKSAFKGADTQPIQVARGSELGLMAALLAEKGLAGYEGNLEAFLTAHETNADATVDVALRGDYEIVNTYLKIHGGCRGNHAPLDATLAVVREHGLVPEQIDGIEITVDTVTAANEIHHPQNSLQAQFNIPFSIAAALLRGDASLFRYTEENLRDADILAMMEKVSILVDPELDKTLPDKRGAKALIRTRDGRALEAFVDIPEGEPERPLSWQKVEEKFLLLAQDTLGENAVEVLDAVQTLEALPAVAQLVRLFAV